MQSTNPKKRTSRVPEPRKDLSIIIAIPAINEPEILKPLKALSNCIPPRGAVEVVIVLNSPENAEPGVLEANRQAEKDIQNFSVNQSRENFRILTIHRKDIPEKLSGAGYARRIAMDYAMERFCEAERPEGIILSLDADTLCEKDYLIEVERQFRENPGLDACSIYFEHPVEGSAYSKEIYEGIIQYEMHLRYYIEGLRYAGHPHAYHTIGSCFAVRARVYKAQGGMNRRKAGEDFYFLHKIIPLGNFGEINTTCLTPSPRPSLRVPFGTGPVIEKFSRGDILYLPGYHPQVFEDLKNFLDEVPSMYRTVRTGLEQLTESLPESIRSFLEPGIYDRMDEINRNSAGEAAFRKRFFRWFGIFQVLKYINHAHSHYYRLQDIQQSTRDFLQKTHSEFDGGDTALDILEYLRKVQRKGWRHSSTSTIT